MGCAKRPQVASSKKEQAKYCEFHLLGVGERGQKWVVEGGGQIYICLLLLGEEDLQLRRPNLQAMDSNRLIITILIATKAGETGAHFLTKSGNESGSFWI